MSLSKSPCKYSTDELREIVHWVIARLHGDVSTNEKYASEDEPEYDYSLDDLVNSPLGVTVGKMAEYRSASVKSSFNYSPAIVGLFTKTAGIPPAQSILKIKSLKDALQKVPQAAVRRIKKLPLAAKNHLGSKAQIFKEHSLVAQPNIHPRSQAIFNPLRRLYSTVRNDELNIVRSLTPIPPRLGEKLKPVINQVQSQGLKKAPQIYRAFQNVQSEAQAIPTTAGTAIELPRKTPLTKLRAFLSHELGHSVDYELGKFGKTTGTLKELSKAPPLGQLNTGNGLADYFQAELSANQQAQGTINQLIGGGLIPLKQIGLQQQDTAKILGNSNQFYLSEVAALVKSLTDEERQVFLQRMQNSPFMPLVWSLFGK
jgi:hypothetical protein